MNQCDTTGRKLPLPKARYEAPEPWKDADRKQLLQFLKTPSGTKFLLTLHDVAAGRALTARRAGRGGRGSWSKRGREKRSRRCRGYWSAGGSMRHCIS